MQIYMFLHSLILLRKAPYGRFIATSVELKQKSLKLHERLRGHIGKYINTRPELISNFRHPCLYQETRLFIWYDVYILESICIFAMICKYFRVQLRCIGSIINDRLFLSSTCIEYLILSFDRYSGFWKGLVLFEFISVPVCHGPSCTIMGGTGSAHCKFDRYTLRSYLSSTLYISAPGYIIL